MKPLCMKDIAIIDAFPVYNWDKTVLNVGCGTARLDFHLAAMGYRVFATDSKRQKIWEAENNLTFFVSDILDLSSFPVKTASVVIASQVLEHIRDYKTALANLLSLASIRLILTVPVRYSFDSPGHCNYWDAAKTPRFLDIKEFTKLCSPYRTIISEILTKQKDVGKQAAYLIVVDKRQRIK